MYDLISLVESRLLKLYCILALSSLVVVWILPSAFGSSQNIDPLNSGIEINAGASKLDVTRSYPIFKFLDSRLGVEQLGLYSFWNYDSCKGGGYRCLVDSAADMNDNSSLLISTNSSKNDSWSWINGKEVNVVPGDTYTISSRMKVNEYGRESHVILKAFNETSRSWFHLDYCPRGTKGPIDWTVYECRITIPYSVKIVTPVLNAGWSSFEGNDAMTWFDDLSIVNIIDADLSDSSLILKNIPANLSFPTSMAFLGENDILITEKNSGKVKRVYNDSTHEVLDLNVANVQERGLLGIVLSPKDNPKQAFLYLTETMTSDGEDVKSEQSILGNRVYRYDINYESSGSINFTNPTLMLDLPALPGPYHNGGSMVIGPDGYLYVTIGDLFINFTQASNVPNGTKPDGRGGILRIDQEGNPNGNIIDSSFPSNLYFAYGIRNSFGIDFDPVTGKLWDTENGPAYGDEINVVEAGFNSGWNQVQGIWEPSTKEFAGDIYLGNGSDSINPNAFLAGDLMLDPQMLVDFGGKGKYRSPELSWKVPVGLTSIIFINSSMLGDKYKDDLLVADSYGRIYHLDLSKDRNHLFLNGSLDDKIVDIGMETHNVTWGKNFGTISDITIGPDGSVYILAYSKGMIFKVIS